MPPELSSTALKFSFVCPLTAGIHARPASQLAEVANNFRSELVLTNLRNSREANTKSVLSIIAADIRHGDRCSIYSRGPDEQPAHAAVRRFVEETLPLSDHCRVGRLLIGTPAINRTTVSVPDIRGN